jgi:hypothetical protein
VCRQDIDHDVAALGQEVREGKAVVPGELEAHEHLLRRDPRVRIAQMGGGRFEPRAAHEHCVRFRPLAIGPANDELVEGLAGVHADVDAEGRGVGALQIGIHAVAPGER